MRSPNVPPGVGIPPLCDNVNSYMQSSSLNSYVSATMSKKAANNS